MKRKSDITREPYAGKAVCGYSLVMGPRCRRRATVRFTVVSYVTNPEQTLTGTDVLCGEHADKVEGDYAREYAKHPEYFDNFAEADDVVSETTDVAWATRWFGSTGTATQNGEVIRAWGKDEEGYLVAVRTDSGTYPVRSLPAVLAHR